MAERTVSSVDATPTWEAMLPVLLILLEDGDDSGQETARQELVRMARAADSRNVGEPVMSAGKPTSHHLRMAVEQVRYELANLNRPAAFEDVAMIMDREIPGFRGALDISPEMESCYEQAVDGMSALMNILGIPTI